ncbi:sugar kinase [Leucobacter sp. OLJS4]|uniref:ROK family transcriptional regulator n=1 Tax=unclassified Leucobacter TaxID=2621730 RepID=UPI000C189C9A|nr:MULTISPECIES: ROK family transcriptional regulator [unclassified Leucobacter]PII83751.1 sugar kinase [Leucobacter sp. OLCALW19]PII89284.1 sugar kinase [Leucobacter sp. OLTLW20]PII90719.1 sugar kinase [Leucobacter sp. OLAS13]PII99566.1 sugar kinase [Leucobacter sp. OLDS2]PIJ01777.1 sugar kinase [Leucobacter sp. OLCS4]
MDPATQRSSAPARRAPGALRVGAKALPGDARRHNRTLVLQTVYRSGPASRADIARATQLTKVTVSDLVSELTAEGLMLELGTREVTGPGKPAMLVDLARTTRAIVSLDLSDHRRFRGAVLDLDGRILHRADAPLEGAVGDAAVERAVALAGELIARTELSLLGLGVGTPGVVDDAGTVRTAPNLGWADVPLQRILQERTGLPTVVANDGNAGVLAEHNFGGAGDDLMLIAIGHGLGSGLIVGGVPVVGSSFAGGEIGQVMVGSDLRLDAPYSREQVLEHWLSVPGLTTALAEAGDDGRERVLREAGQRLGTVLAPVVGALNLSEIVLSGPQELVGDVLADATLEILQRRTLPESHRGLVIRTSSQGADLILRGATALVLQAQLGIT